MQYLRVRNWQKWQSYRNDRGQPPWIKLHRQVMRDPDWVNLSAAQRGELVCVWLLGADRDGVIPADPELVRKLCYLDQTPDLEALLDLGFLEPDTGNVDEHEDDEETNTEGKLYFIRYQGTIKIGFSKNPWARVAALKTAMPFEPELVGHLVATKNDERALQELLSEHRTNREWFEETAEVRACVEHCLATGSIPDELPSTTRRHTDAPEEKRIEENRGEENRSLVRKADECEVAFDAYNALAEHVGLPRARKLTPDRKRKLRARLNDVGLQGWRHALENLATSEFCRGRSSSGWRADFDFLLQPKSLNRLIEGTYNHDQRNRTDDAIQQALDELGRERPC